MTSASAKITLTYPLYACDFDPNNANRLVVGGGGGAGRSGVGNKITVLDTTSPEALEPSAEIELSRDEDNVTSLAVISQAKGKTALVYAGVNSSPEEQKNGENKHFRVFGIDPPSAKAKEAAAPKISELSRTSLFSNKDPDAYQRIVRLSAPFAGSPQMGAAATGLAKQAQIVLFEASTSGPKSRGRLNLEKEANDLDVIQTSGDQYRLVYCNDYEIHSMNIPAKGGAVTGEPQLIFTTPEDVATGYPRPSFRAIRFLTPGFLLTACNMAKRSGVVLQAYRIAAGATDVTARLSASAKLPKHVAQTTALAVTNLHPPTSPGAGAGDTQFVVAVAGVDCSITLYTLEHSSLASIDVLSKLYPFATVRGVHPHPISGLSFSRFQSPGQLLSTSVTSPSKASKSPASDSTPPVLKLASISVANTAVVHTIPLKKLPAEKPVSDKNPCSPKQPARYVVAARSHGPSPKAIIVVSTVGILLLAMIMQTFLEVRAFTPRDIIGARKWAPASWLKAAGHWGEEMGEAIFKGVLFSELGGVVGGFVRG
ncbi:hypothetical protein MAPG_03046 [Magnaporthiopsis poae ATCC 64411]|uniref:Guanine nucleotide-exchange factor SEC12 n=1 Tax=Magnaporthiopsis poae (strain ATCC 64411 / 73-15) TaxID=644358 RepID=A0A0C4DSZ8_MAGP6|nr:hypothetical protein MAPG_03046 [Magnaporthiopsis poae ATCC 64411]